ncbi:MAG: efflux RND transporter periplasmic adaptor subunit [Rhodospirillales bacterium]|jgi:membrane fusion protein, multidrug efflux system|nr:efflux RND transporter periplasmic adaptor subunit [Rhodospirillales bacterium]
MKTRSRLSAVLTAIGTAAALMGGGVPDAGAADEPGATPEILPVETLVLRASNTFEVTEGFAGRVVASRQSDLGFERSGTVTGIQADEGDRVNKGAVLANLDTSILKARRHELNAQLAQTRATYQEIEARLDYARATVKRRDGLMRNAHVSRQSYDEARFDERALTAKLKANEATVAAVRAEINALAVQLDRSRIVAPFKGTVVARHADEGTAVNAGTPLLRLIEDDALEVRIGVSGAVAETLEPGQVYDIRIGERAYPAVLRVVLPTVEPETRTVPVVLLLGDFNTSKPRSGQLATLEIRRQIAERGFWLPVSALTGGRRGLWSVYVVTPTDNADGTLRVERRDVQIIHGESERVFVRGTLRDGERAVATGMHRLVPGQTVRLAGSKQ